MKIRNFFLGIISFLALPAMAGEFSLSAGACHYSLSKDGTWWQSQFEHSEKMDVPCFEAGFRQPFGTSDYGFDGAILKLGNASTDAIALSDSTLQTVGLDPMRPECETYFHENCKYRWRGHGSAYGFKTGIFRNFQDVSLSGGVLWYRAEWFETITSLETGKVMLEPNNGWPLRQVNSRFYPAPYLGIRFSRGNLFLSGNVYGRLGEHNPVQAGFKSPVYQVSLGVIF